MPAGPEAHLPGVTDETGLVQLFSQLHNPFTCSVANTHSTQHRRSSGVWAYRVHTLGKMGSFKLAQCGPVCKGRTSECIFLNGGPVQAPSRGLSMRSRPRYSKTSGLGPPQQQAVCCLYYRQAAPWSLCIKLRTRTDMNGCTGPRQRHAQRLQHSPSASCSAQDLIPWATHIGISARKQGHVI